MAIDGDRAHGGNERESRMKQYKNVGKADDLRRRRNECSVELRKAKGTELLMKRRNIDEDDLISDGTVSESDNEPSVAERTAIRMPIAEVLRVLQSKPDIEQLRNCMESVRRALSSSKNPPVDEIISCGLLEALIEGLRVDDDKVRYESAWALTNIVSGTSEQTIMAVKAGAARPLIELTMHPSLDIAEQALWAVANIAGDSAALRDIVIGNHGIVALLELSRNVSKLSESFTRTLAWAVSNMCRHKNPHASIEALQQLSICIPPLLQHSDVKTRCDAAWSVCYLTDGPDSHIELARNAGLLSIVVSFLDLPEMVAPCLRVLGNVATGNDELTQCIIDLNVLPKLQAIVDRAASGTTIRECCWLLSNIVAGSRQQIQAVIDAGLLSLLKGVFDKGEYKCQYEAVWAIANLVHGGSADQVMEVVNAGFLPSLCSMLGNNNVEILSNALESIDECLNVVFNIAPDRFPHIRDEIEESGGLDKIEEAQTSPSTKVYKLAYDVVTKYFSSTDADNATADDIASPPVYSF